MEAAAQPAHASVGPRGYAAPMTPRRRLSLLALTAIIGGSGVLHLVAPEPYRRIVPAPLAPWRGQVVTVSGLAELACALLLLAPRTRRAGATATALLLCAVFPANVQMALDGGYADAGFPFNDALLAWLRLPLQAPLVVWALGFRRAAAAAQAPSRLTAPRVSRRRRRS